MTSDAGLLLPRELERLGLNTLSNGLSLILAPDTTGNSPTRSIPPAIDTSLAGYEDTNDAERLAEDPALWMLASRERRETNIALTLMRNWSETKRRRSSAGTRGPPIELERS